MREELKKGRVPSMECTQSSAAYHVQAHLLSSGSTTASAVRASPRGCQMPPPWAIPVTQANTHKASSYPS
jgi:hypothetical protein